MTRMMFRSTLRPLLVAALPLALAGCISFGAKPPPYLLSLTPDAQLDAGATASGPAVGAITVLTPEIPQKLSTPRVPVRANATEIAYVEGAQWVDTPHRLFRRLLSETIAAKTGRLVLDEGQGVADPGTRLAGDLVDFDVDATAMQAVVTYDATLVIGDNVSKRRFQSRVPIAAVEPQGVGIALNTAANAVAGEVAAWIGGR
ncbi:ABC transporter [Sphingorhabdus soli]|uniref:ABC transporter n=1 Tax=Flavisphingopyxis soli TaxID=2601267 RepID=A0A5C6UM91_9SPHN|nr:ABC-type transport auxiliary lipoprotein family protein [Sphingorhabdus soli]TXC73630.1 ABC transporter [Sphingorhabdus soli]